MLHAQPIVDLATGEATQYELLLRMRGADGELIPPSAFLPVAERFDLMAAIDRWVVARAIRMVGAERRARPPTWSSRSTSPAARPATPSCSS